MRSYDFSVSICVYAGNHAEDFDAAIESVLNQTQKPAEIVLTVDGPIPESIEKVITKYEKAMKSMPTDFKVIRLQKNMGHGEARRVCFENCSFDLIALMDADDLSVPTRFEKQIAYFKQHEDVSAVGGNIREFIASDDSIDTSHTAGMRVVPAPDAEIKAYMQKRCPLNQVTVMFRKEDVASVGGYLDWYCEEDYYLWLRLALAGKKFGNIGEVLVDVRVSKEMYQRRGGWKYFKSEAKLQKFMFSNRIITLPRYLMNVSERFVLQVLMPNKARGWIFQKFARKN